MINRKVRKGLAITALLLSVTACSVNEPELDLVEAELTLLIDDTDLSKYTESLSYSYGEKKDKAYPIKIKVKATDKFSELSDIDAMILLSSSIDTVKYHTLSEPECGGVTCTLDELEVTSGKNTYSLTDFGWYESQTFESASISFNGEKPVTEKQIEREPQVPSEESSVNKVEVYNYMKSIFDRLTNNGANYIPEKHDAKVAEFASNRFDISEEEALRIYEEMEMNAGN